MGIEHDADTLALLTAVQRIFHLWKLTDEEVSKIFPEAISNRWASEVSLKQYDVKSRALTFLDLYENLAYLYASPQELRAEWFKKPNKAFAGKSPFQVVVGEPNKGLDDLKNYL